MSHFLAKSGPKSLMGNFYLVKISKDSGTMDRGTIFLLASEITEDRTLSSAMKAFRRASSTSANQPYSITIGKYKGYYPAAERLKVENHTSRTLQEG